MLIDLLRNPFLIVAVSSWALSQVAKLLIYSIMNKKFEIERLYGDGGMPSAHSATVCSLAAYSAITYGTASFQFAVTAILALIVCHDAMGVRRETGKQAVILNEIRKNVNDYDFSTVKLKEFVGHTPAQVIVGGLLGIINAIAWSFASFLA